VGKEVAYPFGYGLSYTTFEYSNLSVTDKEVRFRIKNTGDMDGVEIAQVYVGIDSKTVFRPIKELKGFQRVALKAGEEKEVVIALDDKAFRFYDSRTNTWEVETGPYIIMVGRNANQVELQDKITVIGTVEQGPYSEEVLPSYFAGTVAEVSAEEFENAHKMFVPGFDDYATARYGGEQWEDHGKKLYDTHNKLLKKGNPRKRINVKVYDETHMKLRIMAAIQNRSLDNIVSEIIEVEIDESIEINPDKLMDEIIEFKENEK
jgi:hypothetical protein